MKNNLPSEDVIAFLGERGFTIDSLHSTPYKLYVNGTRTIELSPLINNDSLYGLSITQCDETNTILLDKPGVPFEQIPHICTDDVIALVAKYAPHTRLPRKESYIISSHCSLCGTDVPSFIRIKDSTICVNCLLI